ncbi:MAG TPA: trypsin-like peptidase domain-containing protein, partial [Planctomycetia bacterium]|nr:trypsin-like peptidase domain-containing protein [Planctomycetia bacterium]
MSWDLCVKIATACAAIFALGAVSAADPPGATNDLAEKGLQILEAQEAAVRAAIDRALPSVATLFAVEKRENDFVAGDRNPRIFPRGGDFNQDQDEVERNARWTGAGIVLDRKGRILTCYHVVRPVHNDQKLELVVRTQDGRDYRGESVRIIAGDPRSDLAVVEIKGPDVGKLAPMP